MLWSAPVSSSNLHFLGAILPERYSLRIIRAVSGIESNIRFFRSVSRAFSISSVIESMKRFIATDLHLLISIATNLISLLVYLLIAIDTW